jgi:nitrite reductase/ring-hydroxylating ferredoxin subunit
LVQVQGEEVVVARSEDVAEGGRTVVSIAGTEVGIFRLDGELYAYDNWCVHEGGPACQGLIINRVVEVLDDEKRSQGDFFSPTDVHIVCPWHGYEYNIRTGEHAVDPRIRLKSVRVAEDGGEIRVWI